MVIVLVGLVSILGYILSRMLLFGGGRSDRERGGGGILLIVGLVFMILAPIFATLIQLAISRKREFLADASGALLTRYPEGLASALEKISSDREPLEAANRATAHLYIASPFKEDSENKISWVTLLINKIFILQLFLIIDFSQLAIFRCFYRDTARTGNPASHQERSLKPMKLHYRYLIIYCGRKLGYLALQKISLCLRDKNRR